MQSGRHADFKPQLMRVRIPSPRPLQKVECVSCGKTIPVTRANPGIGGEILCDLCWNVYYDTLFDVMKERVAKRMKALDCKSSTQETPLVQIQPPPPWFGSSNGRAED